MFGPDVPDYFAKTFSITVVGAVLFDLLITTNGMELKHYELVEHVETVIREDLKLQSLNSDLSLHSEPLPEVLYELYRIMREQVWPQMADNPIRKMTARLNSINYDLMEISFSRVECNDGS